MILCTLLTPWKGSGTQADPYRPAILDDHPAQSWEDVSGLLGGSGPAYQIRAIMSPATYNAILGDPKYGAACVLSATGI